MEKIIGNYSVKKVKRGYVVYMPSEKKVFGGLHPDRTSAICLAKFAEFQNNQNSNIFDYPDGWFSGCFPDETLNKYLKKKK